MSATHMSGLIAPRDGIPIDWRRHLAYRETDRFVTEQTALRPLSVAADRIAHAAMRCAVLLADLTQAGVEVDRSGMGGKVVEVYLAASLIAALSAAAAAAGLTSPPPPGTAVDLAQREGWIALPHENSLAQLA